MTDNVPKVKDWQTVNIHINKKVWTDIKILAVRKNCTIKSIVEQGLMTFMKFLLKAEIAEELEGELEQTNEDLNRVNSVLEEIKHERRTSHRKRGRHKKKEGRNMDYYFERYPGLNRRLFNKKRKEESNAAINA